MTTADIEKRLDAIERQLANLQSDRAPASQIHPIHSLEKIHGSFENDEAFKEATRLGREWRESQRPKPRKSKANRK